jgi:hypothetical protein
MFHSKSDPTTLNLRKRQNVIIIIYLHTERIEFRPVSLPDMTPSSNGQPMHSATTQMNTHVHAHRSLCVTHTERFSQVLAVCSNSHIAITVIMHRLMYIINWISCYTAATIAACSSFMTITSRLWQDTVLNCMLLTEHYIRKISHCQRIHNSKQ